MPLVRTGSSKYGLLESAVGMGLFTTRDVIAGEVLFVCGGPIIDFLTADARGEAQCYALQCGEDAYVDLAEPAKYINHSCDPNCGVRDFTMIALHAIEKDREVTFDYSTSMDERSWTMACRCGSVMCRGIVDDFRTLPVDIQRRYLDLGIVMPFIAAQYEM